MTINPIEIQIESDRKFTLIAFLVDRDDFLKDIADIRSKLKILKIPYHFPDAPYDEAQNVIQGFRKNLVTISQAREILQEIYSDKGIFLSDLDRTLASAFVYTEGLARKYNKSRLYIPVILASILVGRVQEYDFLSTYRLDIDIETLNQLKESLNDAEEITAIAVNRESAISEVEEVFNSLQKYHFGTQKIEDNDPLAKFFKDSLPKDRLQDTISNIKRDREWYWKHKTGLSHQKIWEQTDKKIRGADKGVVAKAIKQYRHKLAIEI